jgi:hypothetical protein
MPVARERTPARSSFRFDWPGKNTVIAILLVVFLVLHVVAGVLLQDRAPTGVTPVREEAKISLQD